jgi:nuclear pore complex protein Nup62
MGLPSINYVYVYICVKFVWVGGWKIAPYIHELFVCICICIYLIWGCIRACSIHQFHIYMKCLEPAWRSFAHSMCECVSVCLYVSMHVCMYVCMYVYMCIYICVYEVIGFCLCFIHSVYVNVCVILCVCVNFLSFFFFLSGPKKLKEFIVFLMATGWQVQGTTLLEDGLWPGAKRKRAGRRELPQVPMGRRVLSLFGQLGLGWLPILAGA